MTDPVEQRQFFDRLSGARPFFDGMALIALDGNMVANDPPIQGLHINVSDRDYFGAVLASGRSAISKPVKARTTGQPAVLMAVPVKDANAHLIGVLAGGLNLSRTDLFSGAKRTAANMSADLVVTTGGRAGLHRPPGPGPVAPAGRGHARPRGRAQRTRRSAQRGHGAQQRLAAASGDARRGHVRPPVFGPPPHPGGDWCIRPADCSRRLVGVGLALRPLGRLHQAMLRLREHGDALMLSIPHADDEIGDLARAFTELMHQSQDHQAELAAVADASPLGLFRTNERGEITYTNGPTRPSSGPRTPSSHRVGRICCPPPNAPRQPRPGNAPSRVARPGERCRA
jgi:PAS domain-containing protein